VSWVRREGLRRAAPGDAHVYQERCPWRGSGSGRARMACLLCGGATALPLRPVTMRGHAGATTTAGSPGCAARSWAHWSSCVSRETLRGARGSRVAPWAVSSASIASWRARVQGGAVGRVVRVNCFVARAGPGWRRGSCRPRSTALCVPPPRGGAGSTRAGRVRAGRGERRPVEPYAARGPSLGERRGRVFHVKRSRACGVGGVAAPSTQLVRGAAGGLPAGADPTPGRPAPGGKVRNGCGERDSTKPFAARGSVWAASEAGCFT
jgi:hypothetical protein